MYLCSVGITSKRAHLGPVDGDTGEHICSIGTAEPESAGPCIWAASDVVVPHHALHWRLGLTIRRIWSRSSARDQVGGLTYTQRWS